MGYYTDLRVYDYFGVIDPVLAHRDVATLGHGKPGHEKQATLDDVLAKKPTYVIARYLPDADLSPHGYAYHADIPLQGGVWVRTPAGPGE